MKTGIILATAFIRTVAQADSEQCILQLVSGINRLAEFVKKYPGHFDLYWVDNTIEPGTRYDSRLLAAIENLPNLKDKKQFFENYFNPDGTVNKGCGVVAIWDKILAELVKNHYEFVIHFEPRQEIANFSFFETFVVKPDSYFKTMRRQMDHRAWRTYLPPYGKKEVWTGLLSCPPQMLSDYVAEKTRAGLDKLAEEKFHLEGDLYGYLKKNHISFTALPRLGLLWHDNLRRRRYTI